MRVALLLLLVALVAVVLAEVAPAVAHAETPKEALARKTVVPPSEVFEDNTKEGEWNSASAKSGPVNVPHGQILETDPTRTDELKVSDDDDTKEGEWDFAATNSLLFDQLPEAAKPQPQPRDTGKLVNIGGLNKPELLKRLWEAQIASHNELWHHNFNETHAFKLNGITFDAPVDYHLGRVIAVDFRQPLVDPTIYDRSAGRDRFRRIVHGMRSGKAWTGLTDAQKAKRAIREQARQRYILLMTMITECEFKNAEGWPIDMKDCISEMIRTHAAGMAVAAHKVTGDFAYSQKIAEIITEATRECSNQYSSSCKKYVETLWRLLSVFAKPAASAAAPNNSR